MGGDQHLGLQAVVLMGIIFDVQVWEARAVPFD